MARIVGTITWDAPGGGYGLELARPHAARGVELVDASPMPGNDPDNVERLDMVSERPLGPGKWRFGIGNAEAASCTLTIYVRSEVVDGGVGADRALRTGQ